MFIDLNCFLIWAMWPMGLLFLCFHVCQDLMASMFYTCMTKSHIFLKNLKLIHVFETFFFIFELIMMNIDIYMMAAFWALFRDSYFALFRQKFDLLLVVKEKGMVFLSSSQVHCWYCKMFSLLTWTIILVCPCFNEVRDVLF